MKNFASTHLGRIWHHADSGSVSRPVRPTVEHPALHLYGRSSHEHVWPKGSLPILFIAIGTVLCVVGAVLAIYH
jgi:hypothetical protein